VWAKLQATGPPYLSPHSPLSNTAPTRGPTWSTTHERTHDNWGPTVRRDATPTRLTASRDRRVSGFFFTPHSHELTVDSKRARHRCAVDRRARSGSPLCGRISSLLCLCHAVPVVSRPVDLPPRAQRHPASCGFHCGPVDLVSGHLQAISTAPLGPRHRLYLNLPRIGVTIFANSATKAEPTEKGEIPPPLSNMRKCHARISAPGRGDSPHFRGAVGYLRRGRKPLGGRRFLVGLAVLP
jgi:hypothetical protein